MCLVFKGERTAILRLQLPMSGLLDDSSPKQVAALEHIHPRVPLSLAASNTASKRGLIVSLTLSFARLSVLGAGDPTSLGLLSSSKKMQLLALEIKSLKLQTNLSFCVSYCLRLSLNVPH